MESTAMLASVAKTGHEKEDGALREGITDHGCHHAPSRPW
jgi:hypothetical protein